jgi:hypothetical protein
MTVFGSGTVAQLGVRRGLVGCCLAQYSARRGSVGFGVA